MKIYSVSKKHICVIRKIIRGTQISDHYTEAPEVLAVMRKMLSSPEKPPTPDKREQGILGNQHVSASRFQAQILNPSDTVLCVQARARLESLFSSEVQEGFMGL